MLALPLLKRFTSHYFLRVGLCPTPFLPVQDAWRPTGRRIPSGRRRSRGTESTRSSIRHVRYIMFKLDAGWATRGIVRSVRSASQRSGVHRAWIQIRRSDLLLTLDGSASCDLHQTDTMSREFLLIVDSSGSRDFHRTATMTRERLLTPAIGGTCWSVRSPSYGRRKTSLIVHSGLPNSPDLDRTTDGGSARTTIVGFLRGEIKAMSLPTDSEGDRLSTKLMIVARSWRDHGPIMARSWPDRGLIVARSWPDRGSIVARSWPDRGAIVARSWRDRGFFLKQN